MSGVLTIISLSDDDDDDGHSPPPPLPNQDSSGRRRSNCNRARSTGRTDGREKEEEEEGGGASFKEEIPTHGWTGENRMGRREESRVEMDVKEEAPLAPSLLLFPPRGGGEGVFGMSTNDVVPLLCNAPKQIF